MQPWSLSWSWSRTCLHQQCIRSWAWWAKLWQRLFLIPCVTDIWDPPPFPSILPSLPSHSLWDMITNDKKISLETIHRWRYSKHHLPRAKSTASLFFHFLFSLDLFISSLVWLHLTLLSHHHAYALASAWLTHPSPLIIIFTLICHFCLLLQTLPSWLHSLYV